MNKATRQQEILNLLISKERIEITELCDRFHIVPMTARRDLKELEEQGKLIRTHGGAALPPEKEDVNLPFFQRTKINTAQKLAIAAKARTFLKAGQHIFLASGTTVHAFAQSLNDTLPLTVITDAVNIAYELSTFPNIQLLSVGGELRPNSLTLTGKMAEENLSNFQMEAAFIGINGIDRDGNIYVSSIVESSILNVLFDRVPDIYILADASKLGQKDFVHVGALDSRHTLITTNEIPKDCLDTYQALGAEIILA
ncbi:MAG TPA: DeoR/GlpR family DNA-binding transcription regulator [Candidatus Anaerostipes avicola]|nr:DeoR/GlpR family DNA-binding transcription regulator [uncultured Anaerostipes sp.]HJC82467.1 DeoR/GlpR family DNA-binding transcription regulator [Candidatus Anaerostipes avicola]